jgi:hypothetical protein
MGWRVEEVVDLRWSGSPRQKCTRPRSVSQCEWPWPVITSRGVFAVALGAPAAHEASVVQEEPEQVEVRVAQVAAQRETGAKPRVGVLEQRTAARCLRRALIWLFQRLRRWNLGQPRPPDSVEQRVELASHFRTNPLPGGVKQMHAPGVGVAMVCCRQQISVSRRSIDPGQHRHYALEEPIVQAHVNGGQVRLARCPRGRLKHLADGAHTDRYASSSRMNSMTPRHEPRHISASATITWHSQTQLSRPWGPPTRIASHRPGSPTGKRHPMRREPCAFAGRRTCGCPRAG